MIIWTALPNGFTGTPRRGFRLSVLVSPRLTGNIGIFADWPAWVRNNQLAFRVTISGCAGAPAPFVVTPDASHLDSALWNAIFDNTAVMATASRMETLESEVCSYSYGAIAKDVKGYYAATARQLAQAPEEGTFLLSPRQPILSALRWHFDPRPGDVHVMDVPDTNPRHIRNFYRLTNGRRSMLQSAVADRLTTLAPRPPRRGANPLNDSERPAEYLRFAMFHRRIPGPPAGPRRDENLLDFHRQLAALMNYPALLRPLGLVFDLLLDLPADSCLGGSGRIMVAPTVDPGLPSCTPSTMFAPAGRSPFRPMSGEDICGGMLRLQDANAFHLETLDVDGAVLKLTGYADSKQRATMANAGTPRPAEEEPQLETPPALHSNGVAIVSNDRGMKVADRQQRMRQLEADCAANRDITLTAADVTMGYVIDVFARGEWRSLCLRDEKYSIAGLRRDFDDRLGALRPAGAKALDKAPGQKTPPNEVYVHEELMRWTGWSLVAPRPKDIRRVGVATDEHGTWIKTEFRPKKLPRLRYGQGYRFRARLVDLSGNTIDSDDAPPECVIPGDGSLYVHKRYDPVPAPFVLVVDPSRFHSVPGEQMNRLVVRDGSGESTRCVVPPRTSHETAETHGLFDTLGAPARGSFRAVTLRVENGDFPRDEENENALFVPPSFPIRPRKPYYPDPLAHSARIVITDPFGHEEIVDPFSFYDGVIDRQWPDARRFFLRVLPSSRSGANFTARWETSDTLRVGLPPGWTALLRLSSGLADATNAQTLAMTDALAGISIQSIVDGRHPMLTPPETLRLVHAVRRPLTDPTLTTTITKREADTTTADLRFTTSVDDKSTAKVEIVADWNEIVDDPTSDVAPGTRHGHVAVGEKNLNAPATSGQTTVTIEATQQFGDPKYRCVDYKAIATSRFREHYDEKDPAAFTTTSAVAHEAILNASRPKQPAPLYILPTFGWSSRKEGRRTFVSERDGGGLRIYLARPWYTSGDGELLGIVLAPSTGASAALLPHITRWGVDPIWRGRVMDALPVARHFDGFVQHRTNVLLPTEGARADVIGYQPVYDPGRRLWYADVEISTSALTNYTPFIKLSLARFQPASVADREISEIVAAEFAQLLPTRSVSITRDGSKALCINVHGSPLPPGVDPVARFTIRVERQCIGITGAVSWIPLPPADLTIGPCTVVDGAIYTNRVTLHDVCGPLRLVIEESELLQGDAGEVRRLVYADVLEL